MRNIYKPCFPKYMMPSKKEQCKKLMKDFFGEATAKQVDFMSEDDCVQKCKAKVLGFLGPEKAKIFDSIK